MKRLTKINLYPVVSFEPYFYDINKLPPLLKTEEERYGYWKKQMKEFNFQNLEPLQKGIEFVRTTQIDRENLINLLQLQRKLVSCDNRDDEEAPFGSFGGGVVMEGDDQIIFIPQCCVGLYDYREWLSVEETDYFRRIYMGHPWIYTHSKGDDLIFSGFIDDDFGNKDLRHFKFDDAPHAWQNEGFVKELDKAGFKNLMCRYVVNYELFQQAQEALKKEIDLFYNKILTELKIMGQKNAAQKADSYVHATNESPSYDPNKSIPDLPFESY